MSVANATLILAAIGAVGTVIAAAYAIRAWRDRDLGRRPRLDIKTPAGVTLDSNGRLPLSIANSGGRARKFAIVLHAGSAFYQCEGSLGERTPHEGYSATLIGQSSVTVKSPVRVVAVAEDDDGRWWNAFRGGRRIEPPIIEWLDDQRTGYGFDCPPLEINL